MGYNSVALNVAYTGKLPATLTNEIPNPLPCEVPENLEVFRRCTLSLSDPSQNHRLSTLASTYDILALRPLTEAALQQACQSLDCDLVSFDFSQRLPFFLRPKTVSAALQRGVRFEICYGASFQNNDGGLSRQNLIGNATQLIRATRGRGIVISSEARRVIACRGPADVINLAVLWGLAQDRAFEALSRAPRDVMSQAQMRRNSFRGVIEVINSATPATKSAEPEINKGANKQKGKRKLEVSEAAKVVAGEQEAPISKREKKRQAKRARLQDQETEQPHAQPGQVVEVIQQSL